MATLGVWEWDREREREIEVEGVCEGVEKSIPFQRKTPSRLFRVSLLFLKHSGVFFLFFHTTKHTHRHNVSQTETQSVQENIYWMYSIC